MELDLKFFDFVEHRVRLRTPRVVSTKTPRKDYTAIEVETEWMVSYTPAPSNASFHRRTAIYREYPARYSEHNRGEYCVRRRLVRRAAQRSARSKAKRSQDAKTQKHSKRTSD